MDLIVDANILFAALIKDSFSYNLLFSDKFHLFVSDYILQSLKNIKKKFLRKQNVQQKNFSGCLKY